METMYLILIIIVLLYLFSNNTQENYANYEPVNIGYQGGVPQYSSPQGMIDWLKLSDLEYGKLVSRLQGKDQSVTIRNLV